MIKISKYKDSKEKFHDLNVLDRSTHNSITQDTLEIKLLLLKLRRILQEVGDTLYHVVEYRIQ